MRQLLGGSLRRRLYEPYIEGTRSNLLIVYLHHYFNNWRTLSGL